MSFELDTTLATDSLLLGTNGDFMLRLANDSRYIWLLLIPTIAGVTEIHQLSPATRHQLSDHSANLSAILMAEFNGDKFNIAALGNQVAQLHIHHIVRKTSDPAWPNPVWGHSPAVPYSAEQRQAIVSRLQRILSL